MSDVLARLAPVLVEAYSFAPAIQRDIVYGYGPYVLFHMLQGRLGPATFYGATDVLLRDHPHQPLTTERLEAYLEAASGKDLNDFFSFWIEGGYVPRLSLVWTAKGGHVTGELRSDVPFGTFDVPVAAHPKDGDPVIGWVSVVDGVGKVDLAVAGKVTKVEIDPGGMVLAHARDSRSSKDRSGR